MQTKSLGSHHRPIKNTLKAYTPEKMFGTLFQYQFFFYPHGIDFFGVITDHFDRPRIITLYLFDVLLYETHIHG